MLLRSLKLLIPGPLYVAFFPLEACRIFSLPPMFWNFTMMGLSVCNSSVGLVCWSAFPSGNCVLQVWGILNYLVDNSFQFLIFVFFFWSFYYSNVEPTWLVLSFSLLVSISVLYALFSVSFLQFYYSFYWVFHFCHNVFDFQEFFLVLWIISFLVSWMQCHLFLKY